MLPRPERPGTNDAFDHIPEVCVAIKALLTSDESRTDPASVQLPTLAQSSCVTVRLRNCKSHHECHGAVSAVPGIWVAVDQVPFASVDENSEAFPFSTDSPVTMQLPTDGQSTLSADDSPAEVSPGIGMALDHTPLVRVATKARLQQ